MEPTKSGSLGSPGSSFQQTNTAAHQETSSGTPPVVEQARHTATQVVDQVKQQASVRLSGQIEQAADGLSTASESIHSVSQQLRDNGQEPIAQYVDRAADQVEHLSTYLRGKDLDSLVSEVEHFARRQPQMFIAGALGLGVLAARFLKSTPERTGTSITVSDNLSKPTRAAPSLRSPTEYHGLQTPSASSPGSSNVRSTGVSADTHPAAPKTTTPTAGTPTTTAGPHSGTSSARSKRDDVAQPTEPMKPLNEPHTGDHGSDVRRSA